MNALHQIRLIVGIGVLAALGGLVAAVLGRTIEPAAISESTAVHVMWALIFGLGQLLAQCWIALFGWGTLRLLAGCGRPATAVQRVVVLVVPVTVVTLIAVTIWIGIQSYASGGRSPGHAALGWATAAISMAALAAEWWVLEAADRAMTEADRETQVA